MRRVGSGIDGWCREMHRSRRGGSLKEALAVEGGSPVRDSFLIFGSPDIREPEIQEVVETLRSGWPGTGPRVARFEEEFRNYVGAKHAVALELLHGRTPPLDASPWACKPGDEVITTPLTFVATVNSILHVGAPPVIADVDRGTMNIDPARSRPRRSPPARASSSRSTSPAGRAT